jgi:hypothetical protein
MGLPVLGPLGVPLDGWCKGSTATGGTAGSLAGNLEGRESVTHCPQSGP